MMNPTNGYDDDDRGPRVHDSKVNEMLAMEMESLHPGSTTVRRQQPRPQHHFFSQLWLLIKLHIESYPKIFSTIGLIALAFFMYMAVEWSKPPLARHQLNADYSAIKMDYNFKAAEIDHWCLFGGDNACSCEDFTEPIPREEKPGWAKAHELNKKRLKKDISYDVVLLGDDVIEEMNGSLLNLTIPDGKEIAADFEKYFGGDTGVAMGNFDALDGLALGIAGDSTSNLLWRLEHGEMYRNSKTKVWWISIGSNDLARGGCSEEATVLGILQVAELVAHQNAGARVVIQAILPRSLDGSLDLSPRTIPTANKIFGKRQKESSYAEEARKYLQLWPSIQHVNQQLREFAKNHSSIMYVDVNAMFVGSVTNALYKSEGVQIMKELMPKGDGRLSFEGHKVLHHAIFEKVLDIIRDEDELNEVLDEHGEDVVDVHTNEVVSKQNGS